MLPIQRLVSKLQNVKISDNQQISAAATYYKK